MLLVKNPSVAFRELSGLNRACLVGDWHDLVYWSLPESDSPYFPYME